ncbi:MAG: ComF family protein [Pseudomonadales bacterium]
MVNNFWRSLLYKILPGHCLQCRKASNRKLDLCFDCEQSLSLIRHQCAICGLPMTTEIARCGHCCRYPPPFVKTISLMRYDKSSSGLINRLKYSGELPVAATLCTLLALRIESRYMNDTMPEQIIPVPLHWKRLHKRGFNQAQAIAHQLSSALHIPLEKRLAKRLRHTQSQQQLNRRERRLNMNNAFGLSRQLKHRHIAIVDDVVTTTETVAALSRTLLAAGASRVDIWSLARTPPGRHNN